MPTKSLKDQIKSYEDTLPKVRAFRGKEEITLSDITDGENITVRQNNETILNRKPLTSALRKILEEAQDHCVVFVN